MKNWGRHTSVKAQPVAAIPLVTQGMAHVGRLPMDACPETSVVRRDAATMTRNFMRMMMWGDGIKGRFRGT
jgi:hypothetical protein